VLEVDVVAIGVVEEDRVELALDAGDVAAVEAPVRESLWLLAARRGRGTPGGGCFRRLREGGGGRDLAFRSSLRTIPCIVRACAREKSASAKAPRRLERIPKIRCH
jgi:hypothetical protein